MYVAVCVDARLGEWQLKRLAAEHAVFTRVLVRLKG